MMVFMLFGGFLLNKERVPPYCRWIAGASFFNYAYEVGGWVGRLWATMSAASSVQLQSLACSLWELCM
jgi:hypothetical protein